MTRSRAPFAAALLAATMLLAACGDDSAGTTTESTPPADQPSDAGTPTEPSAPIPPEPVPAEPDAPLAGAVVVVVAGGSVVEGPGRVEVATGDTVAVTLTSDVSDEVHVHGIDEHFDVTAGEPLDFEFVAATPGVYEIELESAGTLLFELAVR